MGKQREQIIKSCVNTIGFDALYGDNQEDTRLLLHYLNLAMNRYEWKNLPNGIESRKIEEYLNLKGQVFFTEDPNYGFLALPCHSNGPQNIYGNPTAFVLTGIGYSETFAADDGVWIRNNDLVMASNIHIAHFAHWVATIEETIEKNLEQQRNPHFWRGTKDTELSLRAIDQKVKNNETVFLLDEGIEEGGKGFLVKEDVWKDFRSLEYNKLKLELEKELLTFLGLNCVINKESGMNDNELNSNNDIIAMNLELGFKSRKLAEKMINEKYGLNVEVVKVVNELAKEEVKEENV